jgi:hypothetical protein
MQTYTGAHMEILYERFGSRAVIREITPFPGTYLRAGAAHLIRDILGLLTGLTGSGVTEVVADPDRSATRLTLEEAGFRGEGLMRYEPETPAPTPALDMGRPGAFGPDTPVRLEDGGEVPAGALHPGLRLAEGGRVEEVMLARVRRVCRLDGHLYGALNRVRCGAESLLLTDLPGAVLEVTSGTELVWLVTERSRVRCGAHLFEDMWGSAALRQARRISQAEVIAALNASEAP